MAIRAKNIDYATKAMKLHDVVFLTSISASDVLYPVWAAPYDCVVERFNVYSQMGTVHNDSQCLSLSVTDNGGNTVAIKNTALSASAQNVITPSANNSMTAGTLVYFEVCQTCQGISNIIVDVQYVPQTHTTNR